MKHARSCILTYHSLDPSGSVISMAPYVFREQMAFLAQTGAPVVPLHAVRDTPGAVALTFDDGFRNFYEHAFPVLQRYGFPATVFVVSGYCSGRNDWPTQPRHTGVPLLELMHWSAVEEVSRAGIDIGSHTATHPHLGLLSPQDVQNELSASRAAIEDRIGKPVRTFAYPYGESTAAVRAAVRRHFEWACGTRLAYLSPASDPLNLPRIDVYYLQKRLWFQGLHSLRGNVYLCARGLLRGMRQMLARDMAWRLHT
jgi:peptidoglycan/xylan/chitin deacetylase (PgdA/CDA1 family)